MCSRRTTPSGSPIEHPAPDTRVSLSNGERPREPFRAAAGARRGSGARSCCCRAPPIPEARRPRRSGRGRRRDRSARAPRRAHRAARRSAARRRATDDHARQRAQWRQELHVRHPEERSAAAALRRNRSRRWCAGSALALELARCSSSAGAPRNATAACRGVRESDHQGSPGGPLPLSRDPGGARATERTVFIRISTLIRLRRRPSALGTTRRHGRCAERRRLPVRCHGKTAGVFLLRTAALTIRRSPRTRSPSPSNCCRGRGRLLETRSGAPASRRRQASALAHRHAHRVRQPRCARPADPGGVRAGPALRAELQPHAARPRPAAAVQRAVRHRGGRPGHGRVRRAAAAGDARARLRARATAATSSPWSCPRPTSRAPAPRSAGCGTGSTITPFPTSPPAIGPPLSAGIVTFPHPAAAPHRDLFALVEAALLRGKAQTDSGSALRRQ